ncbi:MAG: hypothetical protein ACLRRT_00485 [Ruthenibacterium lactatiformans]
MPDGEKELYDRFGGLDEENFAVAYNDVDFCLRLWQSGLLNVMTPLRRRCTMRARAGATIPARAARSRPGTKGKKRAFVPDTLD